MRKFLNVPTFPRGMETGYCVGDTMSTRPISMPPHMNLQQAALLMREHDVGSILVKQDKELLGIVTHWDLVQRAIAEGMDMNNTPVSELMIADLVTVHPSMDVFEALRLMRDADIRHLPVLEGKSFVGFVTMKDILKLQPQLFDLINEKYELMNKN